MQIHGFAVCKGGSMEQETSEMKAAEPVPETAEEAVPAPETPVAAAAPEAPEAPTAEPAEEPAAEQAAAEPAAAEPEPEYPELLAAIGRYYDNLSRLIRISKAKDETVAKLSKEVQTYRESFAMKLVKPLATELIALREDYRKTMRQVDAYAKSAADVKKYCGYIVSDLEDQLANCGVTMKDGVYCIGGVSIWEKECRKQTSPFVPMEAAPAAEEVPAADEAPTLATVLKRIEAGNAQLLAQLAQNEQADATLLGYVNYVSALDDNYADAYLLPLYRSLASVARAVKDQEAALDATLTEENKTGKYIEALQIALDGIDRILLQAGVTIVTDPSDNYDLATNRLVKAIPTDDPAKDKKVAFRHTDCYMFDGKVLYPCKVDVYKFTPQN